MSGKKINENKSLISAYDIAIVGGGVVGCAVARCMALEGAKVILLEKAPDILDGASKGNSAILHTGFDAPVGSLEQKCVSSGYKEYLEIHESLNLPLLKSSAMVVAWSKEQEDKFESIIAKGLDNGVEDLSFLSKKEILAKEPELSANAKAAISIPREYVIDPWSAPFAYLKQAVENGGRVLFNAEVIGGEFDGSNWLLNTSQGDVRAGQVINCAGLYGDIVDKNVLGSAQFEIKPRKGQFVVFDKAAGKLLNSIILPVPTRRTKGIVLFPTIFGNIVVGPTAEEQESRNDASVDRAVLSSLLEQAVEMLPALANIPTTATYAGIRSASDKTHYRIIHNYDQNWITLGGIRSTGLTGALGIARHVCELLAKQSIEFDKIENPLIPKVPNLAEHLPRDWQTPGYGEIVCHCECYQCWNLS